MVIKHLLLIKQLTTKLHNLKIHEHVVLLFVNTDTNKIKKTKRDDKNNYYNSL